MISVIMPVYNGGRYLRAAIDSILAQTESDFEFIILDDASTDGSVETILSYAKGDARIKFVPGEANHGITARLNQGLRLASRPYIARMDADDISEPARFEKQRAFLDANRDIILVGARVLLIDPDDAPLMEMGEALDHDAIDSGLMGRVGQLVYHPTVMYRAAAARAVGGYDERYRVASDLDFFLKMAEVGRLANLPEPLLRYRQHFSSAGYSKVAAQEQAIDDALRRARQRRGLPEELVEIHHPSRRKKQPLSATYRIWGWWALNGGNLATARKYAFKALAANPTDRETLRLVYCALRGR
ncbi:MAG TPA: glycosyltransferase [Parvularculaceae bacterium]|nr:glycosyltransferase [Parvularculaceae bacterium]